MTNLQRIRMMPKEDLISFMADSNVSIDGKTGSDAIKKWLESGGLRSGKAKIPTAYPCVKTLLKKKYGSINRAAIAMGLQQSNLYCVLNGKISPFPKYMRIIADDLGMDEKELFFIEEEEK